jgi:hypothetical protein
VTLTPSVTGGGVVSAELCRSSGSEYLEAAGDDDPTSLWKSFVDSGGVAALPSMPFMVTRTEAASSS